MNCIRYNIVIFIFLLAACLTTSASELVANADQLTRAVRKAAPGDTILMAKGEWKDLALVFEANGTAAKPIVIMAAEAGKTNLTGNSFIRFAGNFLVISGLKISNGYTLEGAIVEFKKNDKLLANNCRLTNCVITDFSKPQRETSDNWITFWGKNNRMDHCTIGDKLNTGTTLIVELNDERSQNNEHRIDSNLFYKRSPLGSNGGETIRIGVSRYSMTSSNTVIIHNYFEKCNGEVEVISVKSSYNRIIQNTFVECEGSVVLRHGDHNLVDGNLFIGNNKPFTGGIRIINPDHTITNNLVLHSAGNDFRSALTIMNGVPNSPINRYLQVKNVNIHHNSFINCSGLLFGGGKDNERTLPPENVSFFKNFVYTDSAVIYHDLNKGSGIKFADNTIAPAKKTLTPGFKSTTVKNITWHGLTFPYPADGSGADLTKVGFVERSKTGASYFTSDKVANKTGKTIRVSKDQGKNLPAIVAEAGENDVIVLSDAGEYEINATIKIARPITIAAASKVTFVNGSEKSLPAFISIENGGMLRIQNVSFNGSREGYESVAAAITTSAKGMIKHYKLSVENCEFYNFNESNHAGFRALKNTFADSISFTGCLFRNMSGMAVDLAGERDDKGIYNAEKISFKNCIFTDILSSAINVYRGGNDESTTGPFVVIDHCVFNNVDNREQGFVVKLQGVQFARITNSIFNECGKGGRSIWFEEYRFDNVLVDYCNFYNSGRIQTFYGKLIGKHNMAVNPGFDKAGDQSFTLSSNSLLRKKGISGTDIGAQKPDLKTQADTVWTK